MSRDIDEESFEEALVRNCSPTLAGLKPASLFTFPGAYMDKGADALSAPSEHIRERRSRLLGVIARTQASLAHTGLQIQVLVWRACGALVYIYQPKELGRYLADPRAAQTLLREGYDLQSLEGSIVRLAARIALASKSASCLEAGGAVCELDPACEQNCRCAFPHEIGFFLGYPYDDVLGFIENNGQNELAFGAWKVYANLPQALSTFSRYKYLTARFMQVFHQKGRLAEVISATRA